MSSPKGCCASCWLRRVKLSWTLGTRFLMLTHIGRKSGQTRKVVLEGAHHDSDTNTNFVAAGWRGKADWLKNIQANPSVQVTIGAHSHKATAAVTSSTLDMIHTTSTSRTLHCEEVIALQKAIVDGRQRPISLKGCLRIYNTHG